MFLFHPLSPSQFHVHIAPCLANQENDPSISVLITNPIGRESESQKLNVDAEGHPSAAKSMVITELSLSSWLSTSPYLFFLT